MGITDRILSPLVSCHPDSTSNGDDSVLSTVEIVTIILGLTVFSTVIGGLSGVTASVTAKITQLYADK